MPQEPPYRYAATAEEARRWLAATAGTKVVAVDTETSGWDPYRDRLLLVQVAAGPDHPVLVVDAGRVDARVLAPLLGDEGVLKVFHHGSFDLRFLARAGLRPRRLADTMLAQQLLDGGDPAAGGLGLGELAGFRLGMRLDKSLRATFGRGPLSDAQLRYAADDAFATWAVFDQQRRELVGHGLTRVARLEFAALPVLADLQLRGVAFDAPRWQAMLDRLERDLPALEQRVQELLVTDTSPRDLFGPVAVNLASPDQLREALARLGIDVPSTREYVLRDHRDHPAVAALLEWRELSKVTGNWGGDWARRVLHPRTGRVHADWRQIAGSGRIACSDPNLTQVPKRARYRACFGARPGLALVVADYSQQELRILAAVSGDEALTALFHSRGDLHRATAAMVFDVAEDAVTPAQRAAAKQLNFGLLYGMGAPGLARAAGMTTEQARATIDRYFATFPRVAAWLAQAEAAGRRTGKVRTPLGRVRSLNVDASGDQTPGAVAAARTSATLARNAPIQGAGADMTKLALAEVERRLRTRFPGPNAEGVPTEGLVLVVHDELVAEVPEGDAEEAASLVVEGMVAAAAEVLGDVPAAVEVAVRPRWAQEDEPATATAPAVAGR